MPSPRLLAVPLCAAAAGAPAVPAIAAPVPELRDHARAPGELGALVRGADVVGLGEASHSAHETLRWKARAFLRHDFRTLALEVSWSTGRRLDRWVRTGRGDLGWVMGRELVGEYRFSDTAEVAALLRRMRARNARADGEPPLRVVGVDLGYPGPELIDAAVRDLRRAARLAAAAHGASAPRPAVPAAADANAAPRPAGRAAADARAAARRLAAVRPDPAVAPADWMASRRVAPLRERRAQARLAREALRLTARVDGLGANTQQDVRAVARTLTAYAFAEADFPDRMRFRDRAMARTLLWWRAAVPGRIAYLSSNTHVGYVSDAPDQFPLTAGAVLRRALGHRYVAVGTTIGRGRINAFRDPAAAEPEVFHVPLAPRGTPERAFDRLGRDALLDLRTLPPRSRAWLTPPRPVRSYGLYWSPEPPRVSLTRTFDVVVHQRRVTPGRLR